MTITSQDKVIYKQAKEIFGVSSQILLAIEECGEFQHAAARLLNQRENNMIEEIGDVLVMMEQLIEILDIHDLVTEQKNRKLSALVSRMNSRNQP